MRAAKSKRRLVERIARATHSSAASPAGWPSSSFTRLKRVEVADDQAERLVGAPGPLELDVEGFLEAAPVEQVGERVAAGHVREAGDGLVRRALQSQERRGRG